MHRTLLAGRFIVAKHALIKALIGVGVQRLIVFGVVAGLRTAALIKPIIRPIVCFSRSMRLPTVNFPPHKKMHQ